MAFFCDDLRSKSFDHRIKTVFIIKSFFMSKLSNKNIHLLLKVMNENHIAMVSAAPDLSTSIASEFRSIYRIARDGVYVNAEAVNPIGEALSRRLIES